MVAHAQQIAKMCGATLRHIYTIRQFITGDASKQIENTCVI